MAKLTPTVRELLRNDRLDEAFQLLKHYEQHFDQRDQSTLILLASQYNSWSQQELRGMAPPRSIKIQITDSLLRFVSSLQVDITLQTSPGGDRDQPPTEPPATPGTNPPEDSPGEDRDKIVILFLQANPTNSPISWQHEYVAIEEYLQESKNAHRFKFEKRKGVSLDEAIDAIEKYQPDIIHFCGHGKEAHTNEAGIWEQGGIVLHNEAKNAEDVLNARNLQLLFRELKVDFPNLNLIFLNGCHTEEQAMAISDCGLYTLGTTDSIVSEAARKFAAGFYKNYAEHEDLLKAVRGGIRRAITTDPDVKNLVRLYYGGEPYPKNEY